MNAPRLLRLAPPASNPIAAHLITRAALRQPDAAAAARKKRALAQSRAQALYPPRANEQNSSTAKTAPLVNYRNVTPPEGGKIRVVEGRLQIPENPILPFIRGDGTGPDIWAAAQRVLDAAVEKAYGGARRIAWFEVYAGEAAHNRFGEWLPQDTVEAFKEFLVGIKGPLTTPVGGGIRSLNVALRQTLDLYVCLRPVRYFPGVPSPVRRPEKVDMVIFRENTEDIYAGIEFKEGTEECDRFLKLFAENFPERFKKIR
ncbi:MAG: hypothetical protein J7M29_10745, partial [Verrucomicrobia bacterium]|nr:hypothetical protein [Verrucomicrobiota bacterium]